VPRLDGRTIDWARLEEQPFFKPRPVDRPPVEPRRRAGLEPRHRQGGGAQLFREAVGAILTDASPNHTFLAAKHPATQKCARRQHHGGRGQRRVVGKIEAFDDSPIPAQPQRRCFTGNHCDAVLSGEQRLDRIAIARPVGLDARPLHRGALRRVEHPVMDRRTVSRTRHPPVKRIDLAHQMTLAQPADRRIARHRPDERGIETHERHARTKPRCGRRGFGSGVATADHDDIIYCAAVHDCVGA
jgi:hypothetical protein